MPQSLMSTAEVAEAAGVAVKTIHRWVGEGLIEPTVKGPGKTGALLFDPRDVRLLLATKPRKGDAA